MHSLKLFKASILVMLVAALGAMAPLAPASASEIVAGSLADFQLRHPTCSFITNGCTLCARDGDRLACSTAGIACQPGPLVCNDAEPEPITPQAPPAK